MHGFSPRSTGRCATTHRVNPAGWGVYGGKAARGKFAYSAALKNAKLQWNDATLDKWLAGPMKMVPGTKMTFAGLKKPEDRDAVIAYIAQAGAS